MLERGGLLPCIEAAMPRDSPKRILFCDVSVWRVGDIAHGYCILLSQLGFLINHIIHYNYAEFGGGDFVYFICAEVLNVLKTLFIKRAKRAMA